ncbi:MAG: YopX family protein [Treponema sp.]|nr:YopX family protein [Treponema sp.]
MREIIFRGKRKDTGKWMEGSLVCFPNDDEHCGIWSENAQTYLWVIPATVGQYTGISYRDSERIFEGDIVTFSGDKYEIVFEDACFWMADILDEFYVRELHSFLGQGDIRVIGNVHDNEMGEFV